MAILSKVLQVISRHSDLNGNIATSLVYKLVNIVVKTDINAVFRPFAIRSPRVSTAAIQFV